MGEFSIWHWLIVLMIVVMVFGTKKLKSFGSDLGEAVKGFKQGMHAAEEVATPRGVAVELPLARSGVASQQSAEDIAFTPKD